MNINLLHTILEAAKILIILMVINWLMEVIFKWFEKQPLWLKLAFTAFLCSFFFWYPFIDHYFNKESWYKSLVYALVPAMLWYGLTLLHYYYMSRIVSSDFTEDLKDKFFWMAVAFDVMVYFIVFAGILILLKVNWKVFMLVIYGVRILQIAISKPIIKTALKDEVL